MGAAVTPTQLIKLYNTLVDRHGRYAGAYRSPRSSADIRAATAFLRWADEREVAPASFLEFRFESSMARHGRHPRLNALPSETLVPVWRDHDGDEREAAAHAKLAKDAGTQLDQHVESLLLLTRADEAVKYPYATTGRARLCLADMRFSGGFHPESRFCPSCAIATECSAELGRIHGFDVVRLRRRQFKGLPPAIIDAARRALERQNRDRARRGEPPLTERPLLPDE